MNTTAERLEIMREKFEDPAFKNQRGLGNEVSSYIFDYPPEDELLVREEVERLKDNPNLSYFDIYEMVMEILKEKGYLEKCFDIEEKRGMPGLIRAVAGVLKLNSKSSLLVERIKEETPEGAIILIGGVGKIYPLVRSHIILNSLNQEIETSPIVLLYPGTYDGQGLVLFGEIKDDNFYRAFRLVD